MQLSQSSFIGSADNQTASPIGWRTPRPRHGNGDGLRGIRRPQIPPSLALTAFLFGALIAAPAAAQPTQSTSSPVWIRVISEANRSRAAGAVDRHHLPASLATDLAELEDVKLTVPLRFHNQSIRHLNRQQSVRVVGTNPPLLQAAGLSIQRGRFLTERDQQERLNVCVLSTKTAERLFGPSNPVGQDVYLTGSYYTVVGLFEPSPARAQETRTDQPIFDVCIPLTTMRSRNTDVIIDRKPGTFEATSVEIHELWVLPGDNVVTQDFIRSLSIFLRSQIPAESFRITTG